VPSFSSKPALRMRYCRCVFALKGRPVVSIDESIDKTIDESFTETRWRRQSIEPVDQEQIVVGQLGQSLDGQIATATDQSKYINGADGLAHLHVLRAWADVVIVGVGTVIADDPRLTVRLVPGEHPMRLVLDPKGRIPSNAQLLTEPAVRTVVMTAVDSQSSDLPEHVEVVPFATTAQGQLSPSAVLQWLSEQGYQRILVEGGPATLEGFMAANCIDHLHLLTSALLLGVGRPGINQPAPRHLSEARRFVVTAHPLGDDLLLACHLRQGSREGLS